MGWTISVFGLGYVGTVTAACLAHKGNPVIGVDTNPAKVEALEAGRSPIVEPGVSELIAECHQACRLHATTDAAAAVLRSDISFVCVGTPGLRNGNPDLTHIERVCRQIGEVLKKKDSVHLVAVRSTVLPGTTESLVIPLIEQASGKRMGRDLAICVNPEFMREGSAVTDFLEPAITVIGAGDPGHAAWLQDLYAWVPGRTFKTSFRTAEIIKYVCNAWHATKVAFSNEAGALAKQLGVDTEAMIEIFAADNKLNLSSRYLKPGFAFGGSCLPKDVRALNYRGRELDLKLPLIESILPSNDEHLERAVAMILETGKKRIAMLGLSFKAGTDDLRESPQVRLVKRLLGEGRTIQVWDDNVSLGMLIGSNRQYIEEMIPHIGSLLTSDRDQAVRNAELIVIGKRGIAAEDLRQSLHSGHIVIDLVNLEESRRLSGWAAREGICW